MILTMTPDGDLDAQVALALLLIYAEGLLVHCEQTQLRETPKLTVAVVIEVREVDVAVLVEQTVDLIAQLTRQLAEERRAVGNAAEGRHGDVRRVAVLLVVRVSVDSSLCRTACVLHREAAAEKSCDREQASEAGI